MKKLSVRGRFSVICSRWQRFNDQLEASASVTAAGMILALFLVVLAQAISRSVLSQSISWTEEASRLLFIGAVFVGAAPLVRSQGHLVVSVVTERLPLTIAKAVKFGSSSAVIAVCILTARSAMQQIELMANHQSSTLPFSTSVFYWPILFFSVMTSYFLISDPLIRGLLNEPVERRSELGGHA